MVSQGVYEIQENAEAAVGDPRYGRYPIHQRPVSSRKPGSRDHPSVIIISAWTVLLAT